MNLASLFALASGWNRWSTSYTQEFGLLLSILSTLRIDLATTLDATPILNVLAGHGESRNSLLVSWTITDTGYGFPTNRFRSSVWSTEFCLLIKRCFRLERLPRGGSGAK